jgi:hypothetical protein
MTARDWAAFRAKVDRERFCRIGGRFHTDPEAAHIIQRSRIPGPEAMDELNCVPLCRECHLAYDRGDLDLLPYLSLSEQGYAAALVGLVGAFYRVTGDMQAIS